MCAIYFRLEVALSKFIYFESYYDFKIEGMRCFTNRCKSISARIVGAISIFVMVLGLCTAVLGAIAMTKVAKKSKWGSLSTLGSSGLGIAILILGLVVILVGCFGFATCRWKRVWFTAPFVLLSLIVAVVLMILGILMLQSASSIDDTSAAFCRGINHISSNGLNDFNIDYNNAVQNFVCSEQCPCYEGKNKTNLELWASVQESELNAWNRTLLKTSGKKSYLPLVFTSDTNAAFGSWKECYEKVLKPKF